MNRLSFGDILLLRFPFHDGKVYRKRPAFLIKSTNDGDIIVCRVRAGSHRSRYDIYLDEWDKYGVMLPSVVRVHKIATLGKDMLELKIGRVNNPVKERVRDILSRLAG